MTYRSKRTVKEHVYEDTLVWQCTACNCWSRKEFVLVDDPCCPLCSSKMEEEMKNIRIE
ncbi:cold-inducible protein YdjO-related protein [Brevibacillus daliensis]|uniref:cold-inducible protein YdjO-related protein n=1 Tax=Brevibacillus daliensis TaxID=2892995 RepID=UPI001E2CF0D6|nr:cold-inducible protein YdjO-related protein [Brevibacillus daliensis]